MERKICGETCENEKGQNDVTREPFGPEYLTAAHWKRVNELQCLFAALPLNQSLSHCQSEDEVDRIGERGIELIERIADGKLVRESGQERPDEIDPENDENEPEEGAQGPEFFGKEKHYAEIRERVCESSRI